MFSVEEINEMQKTIERKDRIIKVLKGRVRHWVKEYNILDEIIEMYKMSENEANEIIAELKAYKDVNEDFKTAWEELKAENECLKQEFEIESLTDKTTGETIYRSNLVNKYKSCLQEIKAIAEQILNKNEFVYMNYRDVRQIIRLITKAEEE